MGLPRSSPRSQCWWHEARGCADGSGPSVAQRGPAWVRGRTSSPASDPAQRAGRLPDLERPALLYPQLHPRPSPWHRPPAFVRRRERPTRLSMGKSWGRKSMCHSGPRPVPSARSAARPWPRRSQPPARADHRSAGDSQPGLVAGADQMALRPTAWFTFRRRLGVVPDPWVSQSHLTPQNVLEIWRSEQAEGLEEMSSGAGNLF